LRAIAKADPFTYAVHGFKSLLLKEAGLPAIWPDFLILGLFAVIMISIATPLFKRSL
jgi:ABC-2 type transport system permease protein